MLDTYTVVHRPQDAAGVGRFDLTAGRKTVGYLDYRLLPGGGFSIEYVFVSPDLRGKHLGNKLVDAAVAWAESEKRPVSATCGFARRVLASKES